MDNNRKQKKICITGGHLSPAIAVIEGIKAERKPWDIVFVGRTKTSNTNVVPSEEKAQVEKLGVSFFSIHAGRISRIFSLQTLIDLSLIPIGLLEAFVFCIREQPDCVISFGGYVGLPVVVAAWLLDIPTVIHEQTHTLGLSNAIASEFASSILLTFDDEKRNNDARVRVVGLPLRKSFMHPPTNPSFGIEEEKPIVYITGGTTGAVSMNELLFPCIASFAKHYTVIHQTGQQSYKKAIEIKDSLSHEDKKRYIPMPYIASDDVSWIMHHAAIVVGRSGANTVMEAATLQKKAVFIPLPWAGKNEQVRNATWYAAQGGTVTILNQKTASSEEIEKAVCDLISKGKTHRTIEETKNISAPTKVIVETIASLI